jgi:hypothetical protein
MNNYLFTIKMPILGKKPLGKSDKQQHKAGFGFIDHGDWIEAENKESVRTQIVENWEDWPSVEIVSIETEYELDVRSFGKEYADWIRK